MTRKPIMASVLVGLVLLGGGARAADSEADRLREQLRATVLQLRQLQDERAATPQPSTPSPSNDTARKLAATQAQLRAARLAAAKASQLQSALDKARIDNTALSQSLAAETAELEKYKAEFNQSEEAGRGLTADRDGLKAQLGRMTNIATACRAKNERLTKFAESMLSANHDLATQLSPKDRPSFLEPLFGLRTVALENIAQEREDRVRDNHCDPRLDAAPPAKPAG